MPDDYAVIQKDLEKRGRTFFLGDEPVFVAAQALAALARLRSRTEAMEEALREIRELPTEHDLLFNAEVRYLHTLARAALASAANPDEKAAT